MSTNYYLHLKGRHGILHIGQSSIGWTFALRGITGLAENLRQWKELIGLPGSRITNEHGHKIRPETLYYIIEKRGKKSPANDFGVDPSHKPNPAIGYFDKKIGLYRHSSHAMHETCTHLAGKTYDIINESPDIQSW